MADTTGASGFLLKVTEQGIPLARTLPTDSSSHVMSVALSPDDRMIAFATLKAGSARVTAQDLRGDAVVQSMEMAAPNRLLPVLDLPLTSPARFSPSSNYILISTVYGTCVWDFRRHGELWDLPGIEHAKFDTEERVLIGARSVITDDVGTIVMLDGASRRMIRAVPGRGMGQRP